MNSIPSTLDPRVLVKLNMNEDFWVVGNPAVKVTTQSNAIYFIQSDGSVTGGSRNITKAENAKLNGSVYRMGGPIRPRMIVYGLCMEIFRYREGNIPNIVRTSSVVKIENQND